MMNIDNGVISDIMFDDIRILHKQFSQLPAQAFTCHLHGIESIDEDKFSQIVNKKCTIYVVTTDQNNKVGINCSKYKCVHMHTFFHRTYNILFQFFFHYYIK